LIVAVVVSEIAWFQRVPLFGTNAVHYFSKLTKVELVLIPNTKQKPFLVYTTGNILLHYNPPNNFCGLSLDKTDHNTKSDDGYQTISAVQFDIRHLILFRWKENQVTSERSRNF